MLVLAADDGQSGIEIDVTGKKLAASSEVVRAITGSIERIWSHTLDWAGNNHVEFGLVLVLIAFIAVQRAMTKTKTTAMLVEYNLRREEIRGKEPPLPLPPPDDPRE